VGKAASSEILPSGISSTSAWQVLLVPKSCRLGDQVVTKVTVTLVSVGGHLSAARVHY
jgi:hypothetical protein